MKRILVIVLCFFCSNVLLAQQYTVNGNASQVNCHCYILTPASGAQSGSVWNNFKIDLSNSFNFVFNVNLGNTDVDGADGIAFVLQPISTSIGGTGSGLGFGGISPSIGITLDTYQNISPDNDPTFDHIAIQRNGVLDHLSTDNLAGPVPVSGISDNVEDNLDHELKITWDATTKKLSTFFDGVPRVSVVNDLVATTFSGNPLVYWGFTGSTGALFNQQSFCTALTPQWNFSATQKRCVNEPITFHDATISFTTLAKMYWDFGDGSNIDSVNTDPTHIYTVAGDYVVSQKVRGADGCEETNTQNVRIGSKPVAWFTYNDDCESNPITFTDSSYTSVGSINSWYWDFGSGLTSIAVVNTLNYTNSGDTLIKHVVKSAEGCESDTLFKVIHIYAKPVVDFNYTDSVCLGSPTNFFGIVVLAPDPVTDWVWNLGDTVIYGQNAVWTYLTPGNHQVILIATSNASAGCLGARLKNIFVSDKPVAWFTHDPICQSVTTTFTDSSYTTDGIAVDSWWWNLGNGNISNAEDPSTIYPTAGIDTVLLVATAHGCNSDTLRQPVLINAPPTADFGINSSVCSGTPVQFSDSSYVTDGNINAWSWIYNGALWDTIQNPSGVFTVGLYTMGLAVTSTAGCRSDTVFIPFAANPKPAVEMDFPDKCSSTPVLFNGTDLSGGNIHEWHWSFGDGSVGGAMNVSHTYNNGGVYPVHLYAVDVNGCHSDTLIRDINIYSTHAFAGIDTIAAAGQPVQLHAIGGISYEWFPSDGLSSTQGPDPVAVPDHTTTYTVKASTPQGCESYDDVKITIYLGPDIYLPSAFTPNGDKLNDVFKGMPVGLKEFRYMKVYNRWGQEVFSTTDYRVGWDGSWKGAMLNNGIYVVIAAGVDYKGQVISKKATVMMFR